MKIFALNATREFGEAVAGCLGTTLAAHEERAFEDGEHKTRPLESVRGHDVYVVQSLHGDPRESVNDKFCRLLFFLAALREHGAARVTSVVPYLAYARKDRQTKPRDPVTSRYLALLFEAVGVDRIIALEVHNVVAFQNAFRCNTVHLDTRTIFGPHLAPLIGKEPVVVASPDPGGVKRAQLFREAFEGLIGRPIGQAFMEKRRSAGVVTGDLLVGEVAGATVLVVDDLISSGGTMVRAAEACFEHGAAKVFALAAHGLFVGQATDALISPSITRTIVTDSVPPFRLDPAIRDRHLEVVSAAPLFAEAIRRCHDNGSLVALIEGQA